MATSGIDLAEQPVKANDLIGLKAVTQAVPITVEADEAAYSLDQVMILVRDRIVDAISLKITKLGGLRKTYAAAQICAAGGVKYRMGAHVGPMLLAAHALQLAAALPGIWYASELTEFDGLAEDRWEGLKLVDGVLHHYRCDRLRGHAKGRRRGRHCEPAQERLTCAAAGGPACVGVCCRQRRRRERPTQIS